VLLLPGGQNGLNRRKSPHSAIKGIGDFYKVCGNRKNEYFAPKSSKNATLLSSFHQK